MSQNLMDSLIPLVPMNLDGSSDFSVPLVPVNSGGCSDGVQSKSRNMLNVLDSVTLPECPKDHLNKCCCNLLKLHTEKMLQEQQKVFGVLTEKISALQEQLSAMSESRSSVLIAKPSIPSRSLSLSSEDERFSVDSRNKLNQFPVKHYTNSSPSQYRGEQCSWCGSHRHTKEICRRWLGLCFRCGSSSHWLTHCPIPPGYASKSKVKKGMSASFELRKSVKPKTSKIVTPRSAKSESAAKSPLSSVASVLPDLKDVDPPACQKTVTDENVPCESVKSEISTEVVNSSTSELPNTLTPFISSCSVVVAIAKKDPELRDLYAEISKREQEFGCRVEGCNKAGTAYCTECTKHYYRVSVVCSPKCLDKYEEHEKVHSNYKDRLVPCKDNCTFGRCPSCHENRQSLYKEFRDRKERFSELEQLRKKFLELSGKFTH